LLRTTVQWLRERQSGGGLAGKAEERRGKGGLGALVSTHSQPKEQRSSFDVALAKLVAELKCPLGLLMLLERF